MGKEVDEVSIEGGIGALVEEVVFPILRVMTPQWGRPKID
jgi:hypothetical protein